MNLSNKKPSANIEYLDFDKYIILYGSLLSIIENRPLNFQAFIVKLLDNENVLIELMQITGTTNAYEVLLVILNRFPQLCSSKSIQTNLKKHGRKLRQIHI